MIKFWKEVVTKAVDKFGELISGCHTLFFDLSKAFDRVWREGILFKLRKAGVHGHVYNQIKCYLEKRMQRVKQHQIQILQN